MKFGGAPPTLLTMRTRYDNWYSRMNMTTTPMMESEDIYRVPRGAYISTYTGLRFYLEEPEFRIEDIAHALSMNCRYNGHVQRFYSVAEHSVLVSQIMQYLGMGNPLEGLLHDASEAYLSDVPAPFKQLLPDWQSIDRELERKIRAKYWLGEKTEGLKQADMMALFMEADVLLVSQGEDFLDPYDLRLKALTYSRTVPFFKVHAYSPNQAKHAFMKRYMELTSV